MYLVLFMKSPPMCKSKLQTQIALSTTESEYITLYIFLRELIGVFELLKEVYYIFLKSSDVHT